MASISADNFTVNRNEPPYILYDHSRKSKGRRFILYRQTGLIRELYVDKQAIRDGHEVRVPQKMAFAIYLAWLQHQETQRSPRYR